jgi:hypothetical protein
VSVLCDIRREIVKDNVGDVGDIETSGGNGSSDKNRSSTRLEGV